MRDRIDITNFILSKYTEAKVLEQTLDVVYDKEIQIIENDHGQLKCKDLIYPFSRTPLHKVEFKHSCILLDSTENPQHQKDIWEIKLCIKNLKDIDWQPGDTIGILPTNTNDAVIELLQILKLENLADKKCSIEILKSCKKKSAKVPTYIPKETTPREIVRDCLNLKSILKKQFLRTLAEYCIDNDEKEFLKSISSKEGSVYYNDLIMEQRLLLVDILKLCPSCKPPFNLIIEHLTRLLPRPYSIANSKFRSKDDITIIFTILKNNPGVTTNMLKNKCMKETSTVLMYLREPNYFRYTEEDYEKNQILIAIGSGLSPFVGFLQHKEYMMTTNENTKKAGITWLIVGAATEQGVIYRQQLKQWHSQNIINKFLEAHSRIATARYQYVQNALEDNSQELVELLMQPDTNLYVCADGGKISKSLEKSLQNILSKELSINEEETLEVIKQFRIKHKFREDIWV